MVYIFVFLRVLALDNKTQAPTLQNSVVIFLLNYLFLIYFVCHLKVLYTISITIFFYYFLFCCCCPVALVLFHNALIYSLSTNFFSNSSLSLCLSVSHTPTIFLFYAMTRLLPVLAPPKTVDHICGRIHW